MKFFYFSLLIIYTFFSVYVEAKPLSIDFIKVNVSKPETFHFLIYEDKVLNEKINFQLKPQNNERLGLFFSVNNFVIGYSADVFNNKVETKTLDVEIAYQKLKQTKLSFNYQSLEGFKTLASSSSQEESTFLKSTKSLKYEIRGTHNLYTFFGDSAFEHFFLNKLDESRKSRFALSLVSNWLISRFKLESKNSILFTPSFSLNPSIEDFKKINAFSSNFSIGPMLSFRLRNNFQFFSEAKIGTGFFKNFDDQDKLKRTGFEGVYSLGFGASWISESKHAFVNFKILRQEGRHIDSSFGELSLTYFL